MQNDADKKPVAVKQSAKKSTKKSVEKAVESENIANVETSVIETQENAMPAGEQIQSSVKDPDENAAPAEETQQAPVTLEKNPENAESDSPPKAIQKHSSSSEKVWAIAQKCDDFTKKKGLLPLFIIANALLVLSGIVLAIGAFDISYRVADTNEIAHRFFDVGGYFKNGEAIKGMFAGVASSWANNAYAIIGILLVFAFVVPIVLAVKNVFLLFAAKDKTVKIYDAVTVFAFIVAYLGIVNMVGANVSWGQVIALVAVCILFIYSCFVTAMQKPGGALPVISIFNILSVLVCVFVLTGTKVFAQPGNYAAFGGALSAAAAFGFVMMLIAVFALVVLAILQIRKVPMFIDLTVVGVLLGSALLAIIGYGAGKPDGVGIGVGLIVGVLLSIATAGINIAVILVPQLRKYNVKFSLIDAKGESTSEKDEQTVICPDCGAEVPYGAAFCWQCGHKL